MFEAIREECAPQRIARKTHAMGDTGEEGAERRAWRIGEQNRQLEGSAFEVLDPAKPRHRTTTRIHDEVVERRQPLKQAFEGRTAFYGDPCLGVRGS
jgi:hypothetical protein